VKKELKSAKSDNEIKILRERLGRLSGKMAIIAVGGLNEYEIYEQRDKLADGLNTVKLGLKNVIITLIYPKQSS
jgi:chaperonin GroEL (HSP60 family)